MYSSSIYILCLSVCLFESNKHQKSEPIDRAQILSGISHGLREGLSMIKIFKNLPQTKFDFH